MRTAGREIIAEEVQLSREEIRRYGRHLIMPEVTLAGQQKLKAASVLLIGMGGLGSPVSLYLAAAGVGRIGLVDFDTVDSTNLQRQIIYTSQDVGRRKTDSARERIKDANPYVEVQTFDTLLRSDNAMDICGDFDIIIDGTDNFPTRYLVNDVCVLLGKPNVYGSIFRFEGQASVFAAKDGPCYRCLYPEPPPPGLVSSCAEGGVLGVLPGIVGTIQATEALKLILGIGQSLIGQLLLIDALSMQFRQLKLQKNPDCPICGNNRTIHKLIDYEQFCGVRVQATGEEQHGIPHATVQELKSRLDAGDDLLLVDVREPHEYEIVNIGAQLIPLGQLPHRVHELDSSRDIVVHCHHGGRSARAVQYLRELGFRKVWNLHGGIDAWAVEIDPSLQRY